MNTLQNHQSSIIQNQSSIGENISHNNNVFISSTSATMISDYSVLIILELLELSAIGGNSLLLALIRRFHYLDKPSFNLIASLALADIGHGIVCLTYFYPPIVLKQNHFSPLAYGLMNVLDWTSWGITITHMAGIGVDRLLAITIFHRYSTVVTVFRARLFTGFCWTAFLALNTALFISQQCCPVVPLPQMYTFHFQRTRETRNAVNVYPRVYVPLEIACILILALSNPITLAQLYQRYRRKRTMSKAAAAAAAAKSPQNDQNSNKAAADAAAASQQGQNDPRFGAGWRGSNTKMHLPLRFGAAKRAAASTSVLPQPPSTSPLPPVLTMSPMAPPNKSYNSYNTTNNTTPFINRNGSSVSLTLLNNRDVRIFFQIVTVTAIFFGYMLMYYLSFYVAQITSKWYTLFNSLFYSVTHMINPIVYFCLNQDMRHQFHAMVHGRKSEQEELADRKKSSASTGGSETHPLLSITNTNTNNGSPCLSTPRKPPLPHHHHHHYHHQKPSYFKKPASSSVQDIPSGSAGGAAGGAALGAAGDQPSSILFSDLQSSSPIKRIITPFIQSNNAAAAPSNNAKPPSGLEESKSVIIVAGNNNRNNNNFLCPPTTSQQQQHQQYSSTPILLLQHSLSDSHLPSFVTAVLDDVETHHYHQKETVLLESVAYKQQPLDSDVDDILLNGEGSREDIPLEMRVSMYADSVESDIFL